MSDEIKMRYGLIKAYVGSNLVMRHADGVKREHAVLDHAHHPAAKGGFFCFACNRSWPTEELLRKDHPEQRKMVKQEEKHLYAFWSTDQQETGDQDDKGKPILKKGLGHVVGFLSDVEHPELG